MSVFWSLLKEAAFGNKTRKKSYFEAQQELKQRYVSEKKAFDASFAATLQAYDFALFVVEKALVDAQNECSSDLVNISQSIVEQLLDITVAEIKANRLFDFPHLDFSKPIPLSKQIEYRQLLDTAAVRVFDNDEMLSLFQTSFSHALMQFLLASEHFLTHGAFVSISSDYADMGGHETTFQTSVISFQKNLPYHLERLIISFFSEANVRYGLFSGLCTQLLNNADTASGFLSNRSAEQREKKVCTLPSSSKLKGRELVDAYLADTPLLSLFSATVPFAIPLSIRNEHMHIVAGTGHGKTQLLQHLIVDDLEAGRGFMVIDSQGQMINNLIKSRYFDPDTPNSLHDKIIYINPEDIDYPVALNLFAINKLSHNPKSAKHLSENASISLSQQVLLNAAVELYEYLFGALFGAELTSKQAIIFRYLAKLMSVIPDATVHTLRDLLTDSKPFERYFEKLEGSAKAFFQTQFDHPSFNPTKQQVLSRLWMVLSNQSLENIFSSKHNKIDMVEVLAQGKILLVNTSKLLLQDYGSTTLGRFFIALLAQAVFQRSAVADYLKSPYMVYIDEAHEYIDPKLETMLNQARKYNVGFVLAHQNLHQLQQHQYTVFSSTSIKLAGGVSAKDAPVLASEMKTDSSVIMSTAKTTRTSTFACHIKNQLSNSVPISFAFGRLESIPQCSQRNFEQLIAKNRENYCVRKDQLVFAQTKIPKPSQTEISPDLPLPLDISVDTQKAKKTTRHQHLQQLLKRMGNQRGFKATTESKVFDGLGSVDILFEGFDTTIAVEVSSTTKSKWESSNIVKCLSAGFDHVVVTSSDERHLTKLEQQLNEEFTPEINAGILKFLSTSNLAKLLDSINQTSATSFQKVRGYTVQSSFVEPTSVFEKKLKAQTLTKLFSNQEMA